MHDGNLEASQEYHLTTLASRPLLLCVSASSSFAGRFEALPVLAGTLSCVVIHFVRHCTNDARKRAKDSWRTFQIKNKMKREGGAKVRPVNIVLMTYNRTLLSLWRTVSGYFPFDHTVGRSQEIPSGCIIPETHKQMVKYLYEFALATNNHIVNVFDRR